MSSKGTIVKLCMYNNTMSIFLRVYCVRPELLQQQRGVLYRYCSPSPLLWLWSGVPRLFLWNRTSGPLWLGPLLQRSHVQSHDRKWHCHVRMRLRYVKPSHWELFWWKIEMYFQPLLHNEMAYDGWYSFTKECPPNLFLHVGLPFGNRFLNTSWAVGLTYWIVYLHVFCILTYAIIYVLIHHIIFGFIFTS